MSAKTRVASPAMCFPLRHVLVTFVVSPHFRSSLTFCCCCLCCHCFSSLLSISGMYIFRCLFKIHIHLHCKVHLHDSDIHLCYNPINMFFSFSKNWTLSAGLRKNVCKRQILSQKRGKHIWTQNIERYFWVHDNFSSPMPFQPLLGQRKYEQSTEWGLLMDYYCTVSLQQEITSCAPNWNCHWIELILMKLENVK